MADTYGFTTTLDDPYMDRVVDEALLDKNFLVIKETHTVEKLSFIYVLVRQNFFDDLAENYPNERFLNSTLGDVYLKSLDATIEGPIKDFYVYQVGPLNKDELGNAYVTLDNDITRLNNLASGKVLRITVESR